MTLVDFWEDFFVLCHIWTYQRAPSRCLVITTWLSIPLNKPVIYMTTVVQKQTVLGLHMYKMHILFFLSVMFLTCSTIVTKIVNFSREPLL